MIGLIKRLAPAFVLVASALAFDGEPAAPAPAAAPADPATDALAPIESPLGTDQVLAALGRDLHARFNLAGDLQLDFANPWTPPSRFAKDWRVAVIEFPPGAGASMVVRFRVFADSVPLQDATVILRASLWRDAWFAREPLVSGGPLDTAFIEPRRVDSFRVRDAIPAGTLQSDLILTRSIQAGAMLTWFDVGHRPLVRKGDIVEVSASEGLLHVSMKGLALQNGALGDVVTVRNPESLKTIPALVVGESHVEVRL
jgi:flagella basal body P-ring formation protein FlgA